MKNLRYTILILVLGWLVLGIKIAKSQDIVVNEYLNGSNQANEWTELVVVKDNLSLVGWFFGDNNSNTDSWQPKIKFKDISLWKNLRAGTIIVVDHANDETECPATPDIDKTDGFLRICARDQTYFEGLLSSNQNLNVAAGGDFIQIVDPSGTMVHALGHSNSPKTSVVGGSCFDSSNKWTNILTEESATRPCGNFIFHRFNLTNNNSLKITAGTLADFSAGIQTDANNPLVTISPPFAQIGIGNGGENNPWLIDLRTPKMAPQNVCVFKGINQRNTISWQAAEDPFPSDNVIGYIVLRNSTDNFPAPINSKQYALNATIGTGQQLSTVVGIIDNSQITTFIDTPPGAGNFYYRIFPFKFKNTNTTANSTDPVTRGRTYNTTNFVKVIGEGIANILTQNDTLNCPGNAVLRVLNKPSGATIAWFLDSTDITSISTLDTIIQNVTSPKTFWVQATVAGGCPSIKQKVKAEIIPLVAKYNAINSSCGGKVVPFRGFNFGQSYTWNLINPPANVIGTKSDSIAYQITTPPFNKDTSIIFSVQVKKENCVSPIVKDTLFIRPLTFTYQRVEFSCSGKNVTLSAPASFGIRYVWNAILPLGFTTTKSDSNIFQVGVPPVSNEVKVKYSVQAIDLQGCKSVVSPDSIKIIPLAFDYVAADSTCVGIPAIFMGSNSNLFYSWNIVEPKPLGVITSKSDSINFQIEVPNFDLKTKLYYTVSASDQSGCRSVEKKDSLFTVPFSASIVSDPIIPTNGDSILYSINSNKNNLIVNNWTVSNGSILLQTTRNLIATSIDDSILVSADISSILPDNAPFCKIVSRLKIPVQSIPLKPINNLITNNGDVQNNTLDFDRREVRNLEIFNRWGKKVFSSINYQNDWKPEPKEVGTYFYSAEAKQPKATDFQKVTGWVEVVR